MSFFIAFTIVRIFYPYQSHLLGCTVDSFMLVVNSLEREDNIAGESEDKVDAQVTKSDQLTYSVTVKISDVENAGTDVPLYIELIGDKGSSRQIYLEERTDNQEYSLKRATENEFCVRALDVGQVGLTFIDKLIF
jgi:hypothetical protein